MGRRHRKSDLATPTATEAVMVAEGEAIARIIVAMHEGDPAPVGHIATATGLPVSRVLELVAALRALPVRQTPWWTLEKRRPPRPGHLRPHRRRPDMQALPGGREDDL